MVKIFISLWQVLAYFVMVISQIHTESIPLTVVTSLATSFSIDPSQSPEICYFKWSKLDLNPKFAVKTRDELAWFELIQEHQKPSIVRIEETPRSQTTQDVLVSESLQCWQTKRESVRGEDRWVSESTDDYLMLQCEAESCTFSKRTTSTDSFSNRILLNPANLTSFALMTPYTFILLRVDSRSNSAVIELYETNTENAKIRSNRRQLALGDTAVDSTKVLSSGSTMPITLTCDSRAVTSCLLQCPGKPYALFNSASGVCDPCVGAGFIQWDKTMSCQKCDTANNGVTIGHWWDIAGAVGPICKVCHSSCKTCSGPLASDCNLCWEDTTVNYFTTAGLKLAKAAYETTVGSEMSRRMLVAITCSASNTGCVANCASCKVGNSSFCLHPLSGFYLTQDHTLGCNAGATGVYKYQIANGDVCGSCPPRCTNCVNSYTCTSCQVGYPYFDPVAISCVASCPTGFFPAVGNICQACHSSCATCQGPGPAECLTCNASLSYTMKLSSVQADTAPFSCRNSAGCPTYTWPDYTNGICRHCEPSCATCSGSLATQCLTCPASNYLYSDNHCGTCGGAGVTVSGPNCVPCAGSCATCQAGMPSYCLTCTVDLYLNSGAHTCTLCNTPGYFISGSNCVNCNPSCYACSTSGTSACTQCHSGYGLSSTAPSSCVMCTGPNQYIDPAGVCQTCSGGQYMSGNACHSCPAGCTSCTSATQCTGCASNYVLSGNLCQQCAAGLYYSAGNCYSCPSNCHACSGPINCDQCNSGYVVASGRCCWPDQFWDGSSCTACDGNCATCSVSDTTCTSCPNGFQLGSGTCTSCLVSQSWSSVNGGTCISCAMGNCQDCTANTNICAHCVPGYALQPGGGSCSPCSSGFFSDGTPGMLCTACTSGCATCSTSLSTCTSCLPNFGLTGSTCTSCTAGQYWVNANSPCATCINNCATCTGPSTCQTCNSPYKLVGSTCSTTCSAGQYWVPTAGGSCSSCTPNCNSCTGPGATCTQCAAGFYVSMGSCVACAGGQYSNGITCYPCSTGCSACTGAAANTCSACLPGYNLNSLAHTCTSCGSNQFWDGSSCTACDGNCATCSGSATHCTSCANGDGLTASNTCSTCTGNKYFVSTTSPCGDCSTTCTACTGNANGCSACIAGHGLAGGSAPAACVPCLANQFKNGEVCANCGTNCATCSTVPACSTCVPGTDLHQDGSCSACLINAGYFLDGGICKRCLPNPTCKRCNSLAVCLECFIPNFLMFDNTCSSCTGGLYYNPISKNCGTVQNCANYPQGGSACTQCQVGFNLVGGNCIQCPANCATCSTALICTVCQVPYKLYPQAGVTNVFCDQCNTPGKYLDAGGLCRDCDASCTSCSGNPTYCLICNGGLKMVVDTHQCVATCPDGYFDDGTNICRKCAKTCQTCQGAADTCLICKDSSQTPNGMPGKCCVENCATCNNGICSACKSAFFFSATRDCVACDSSCSTCEITAAKCTSCPTGSYLYSDNHCGQCTEAGVFKSDLLCTACDKSCLTCKEKATVCTSCSEKLTLKEGACVVAEIPPGKITLESAVFQKSTVSVSLKFSQVVASIDAGSVRAALYSAKKDDLSLKLTASSPQNYLSELQVPEKTVTVKSVIPTADTLRFDLLIDGEAKDLNLVLAFGKLNAIKSSSEANTAYSPHFAVVEHITVISTNFDQSVAAVQAPAATAVTATTSTLMIASAPQAFVLMKIFQSLDFYVFLNILIPPNFVAFLSMLSSNFMEIMPNIFEMFVGDDAASIKDKFSEFGTQVNIFSNIGPLLTTITLVACLKALLAAFTWGIQRARQGKKSFLNSINESLGFEFFYGFIESNHLDIILAILVFECEQSRLEMSSTAKILTNVFVGSLIAGLVALYGGMSLFVRRAGKALKEKEKNKPEAQKLENAEGTEKNCEAVKEEKEGFFDFLIKDKQFEDGNFFQRNFCLLQLGKDISFAGLLYVAYNSPIGIISLLTGIQIAFIVLVIKYRPFSMKRHNFQLIMTQIIYGLLDLCLLILAIIPEEGTEKVRYYGIGFSLIGLVLTLFIVSFVFAGYEAYLSIKMAIQNLRRKGKQSLNKVEPIESVSLNDSNIGLSKSTSIKSKTTEYAPNNPDGHSLDKINSSKDYSPQSISPLNEPPSQNVRKKLRTMQKRTLNTPKLIEDLPQPKLKPK